jgi:hypothetical protein
MAVQRLWNVGEPGERTWVGGGERWKAPVDDGGHAGCGLEVASVGGGQQVAEWVLSGCGGEGE